MPTQNDCCRRRNCESRCIPTDIVRQCSFCQSPHICLAPSTYWTRCKNIGSILLIALLASYIVTCFLLGQKNKLFHEPSDDVRRFEGIINSKVEESFKNGKVNVKDVLTRIDKMHEQLELIAQNIQNLGDNVNRKEEVTKDCEKIVLLIKEQLRLYDSDKTGRPDFALENSGGCILTVRDTKSFKDSTSQISFFGIPIINYTPEPRSIIQSNVNPGECWAFEGSTGTAVIQLIAKIYVTHVSLEHIPAELAPSGKIDSAPKEFSLWGLESVNDKNPHNFGTFYYELNGPPLQMFPVQKESSTPFHIVEFTVLSNHGHPNYTCVYRVRIHGKMK